MQVGPCIPVAIRLEKAEVGPTPGPTQRLPHLAHVDEEADVAGDRSLVEVGVLAGGHGVRSSLVHPIVPH